MKSLHERLENLSLAANTNEAARSTRHILLSRNVNMLCEILSSSPSGVLITGADRQTRRAIVEEACSNVLMFSASTYVSECSPPPSDFEDRDIICVDDVDFPSPSIEANVKALFPITEGRRTVIGLAPSKTSVAATLLRAKRFEVVHRVVSPTIDERNQAWQTVLQSVKEMYPLFNYPRDASDSLAAISPGYGFHDFSQILQRFIVRMSSMLDNDTLLYEALKAAVFSHTPLLSSIDLPFASVGTSATQPSAVPTGWSGHAGYSEAKQVLTRLTEWPVSHAQTFTRLGIRPPHGVLLHGPHGCGKSMLANAFLHRLQHANWLCASANDLFCKYVGESEARVHALFERGRSLSPCVVMVDDMEVVGRGREDGGDGSSGVERRVLAAFLTELDGLHQSDVFIVACTSDASLLDAALVRPGRLDQLVEIGLPDLCDRTAILSQLLKDVPVEHRSAGKTRVTEGLAKRTDGFTGAMLDAVCREAAMFAMEEEEEPDIIRLEYFDRAVEEMAAGHYVA